MNSLSFLISMLLPTAAGYVLVAREESLSPSERLIVSFSLGTGLLSFYLFGLLRLDIPISALSILPFFVPFICVGLYRRKELLKSRPLFSSSPFADLSSGQKIISTLLVALIVWKIIFILFMICSGPVLFDDAYTTWNYKAKIIYYSSAADVTINGERIFQGPFPHYPLHLPIMRAWIAFVVGQWDETFVNLHSFVVFLCLITMAYEFLRKMIGSMRALLFTAILTGIPVLIYNVVSGYADLAVGYFFLAATIMLFYWQKTGRYRLLIYSGILLSTAMFSKLEGIAIVFPALFIALLSYLLTARQTWKDTLGSMGLFILSSALVVLWLKDSQALNALIAVFGVNGSAVSFHPEGLIPLLKNLFVYRSHNLFWFGILFLFLWKGRTALRPDARFFLIPSVLALAAILFVFLFTSNIAWLLNGTTINRTMLIVIPMLTITGGLLFVTEVSLENASGRSDS